MIAIGEAPYDAPSSFANFIDTDLTAAKLIGAAPTAGSPAEVDLDPLVYPAVLDYGLTVFSYSEQRGPGRWNRLDLVVGITDVSRCDCDS
jgi:hypothetical protein